MSDQDPTPPKDDESPEQDVPPPMEGAQEELPEIEGAVEESSTGGDEDAQDASETDSSFADVLGKGKLSESDEKTMGMLAHILGGVTCLLGPLIIWLIKRDESPFVNDQGKEAVNFQLTVLIAYVVASIVTLIPVIGCISALLVPAIGIASLIFAILGGLEANKGIIYRYPFALRLIS